MPGASSSYLGPTRDFPTDQRLAVVDLQEVLVQGAQTGAEMRSRPKMSWRHRLRSWRGEVVPELDLTPYEAVVEEIERAGEPLRSATDAALRRSADTLQRRAREGAALDELLTEAFALAREASDRVLGLRPYSEVLARALEDAGVTVQVLNAKHDEEEAQVVAGAGCLGAVTISTNMAGRGTDIRLGGAEELGRDELLELGGLLVIGTNRHESKRIDDQLRGRAGRQGDPGESRFFISLEDDLMVRYRIDGLVPPSLRSRRGHEPIDHPLIRRQIERLQRIVEGQNFEIRQTLWRYSSLVEDQRQRLADWRSEVLDEQGPPGPCAEASPERWAALTERFGEEVLRCIERHITLHYLDLAWEEHLTFIAHLREGINLVQIGGLAPQDEFHKRIAKAFWELEQDLDRRIVETFELVEVTAAGVDLETAGLQSPSSTWTYLINDRALDGLETMLAGAGGFGVTTLATLTTWPLLVAWALWRWLKRT